MPHDHTDGDVARTVNVTVLGDTDDRDVIAHVVAAQADPTQHATFVGEGETTVRADLEAVGDWRDQTFVARDETGDLLGVLTVDIDTELGRCWWLGPWAVDDDVARALLAAAAPLVTDLQRREFAPDSRNTGQAALATALGYEGRPASAILELDLRDWEDDAATTDVVPLDDEDRDAVATLHDHLFPGTHTPGRRLVRDQGTTVLVIGEPPHGYVATQLQADASVYIDFLGVAPDARRRGLARALLRAALRDATARGLERAYLTVYESNTAARALYAGLGFVEERIAQPFILERRR